MSVVRVDLHDKLFLVFVVELAHLAVLIAACTYALVSTASIFFFAFRELPSTTGGST